MKPASLDALLARPGRVLGTAGYDFTIIDCEHGAFGIETAESLIRACEAANLAPLVRVARNDFVAGYKALDAGAAGVLAPGVETADEARAWIDALTFAPQGKRGACPIVRAAAHSARSWTDFVQQQAANGLIVMIETAAGVERADAICSVPGIKAILFGPFDLSVSLGLTGESSHRTVVAAAESVVTIARRRQLPVLVPVFARDEFPFRAQIDHWSQHGVRHFAIGADKIIIADAVRRVHQWAADRQTI